MALQDDLQVYWRELSNGFGTGKYRNHKLGVVGGYGFVCLVTLGWSFSGGGDLSNPLGAEIESNKVELGSEHWLQLQNLSEDEWTELRLQLNDKYRHTDHDVVQPGETIQVFVREFDYEFFVPRPTYVGGVNTLTVVPKPGPRAASNMEPETLQVVTADGSHRVAFVADTAVGNETENKDDE